jgi:hypothetical protein
VYVQGNDPQKAQDYASQGFLVVAGTKGEHHGHVAIIVPASHAERYPVGYWGQYGGTVRKNSTINYSWTHKALPTVKYFVRQIP